MNVFLSSLIIPVRIFDESSIKFGSFFFHMQPYLKSKLVTNWSIGLLKFSPFFSKIQGNGPRSSRFLSEIAILRESCDYSSGEEKQVISNTPKNASNSSVHVLNALNNLKGKPHCAFDYFRKCENYGFCHDLSTYSAIISILSNPTCKVKLVSIFCDLISSNRNLNFRISSIFNSLVHKTNGSDSVYFALDALLKAYERLNRDPRESMGVLFHLCKLGFLPSTRSCNFLLKEVAKTCDLNAMLKFFDLMREFRINPDLYSYTILVKFYCDAKRPDEALDVLEQMGSKPDRLIFLTLLSGLCACEKYHSSYLLLKNLAKIGIKAKALDYNIVIKGLCKENRLQEADDLLEDMKKQNIMQDGYTYGFLIKGYCEQGNNSRALDLCDEMKVEGIELTPCIVTYIMQYFRKTGQNYEALCFFEDCRRNILALDKVLYNFGIDIYCRLGDLKKAWKLILEMKSNNLKPDTIHYTCLIGGFCQKGAIDNAHKVFAVMLQDGVKPDLVTYNVLISGYCKHGKVTDAFDLLDEMMKHGIEPNYITHGLVIEGFSKGKQLKEAIIWFKLQVEHYSKIETGHGTGWIHLVSSMVSGFLHSGKIYEAYKLFTGFAKQGGLVNKVAIARLIRELCEEGNANLASNVFNVMINDYQVVPELLSYGRLITAYCDNCNIAEARFWFDDLKNRGLFANKYIYTTLMNVYCKVGKLDKALGLFNEMVSIGIKADVVAYTVLIDGHYKYKDHLEENRSPISKQKKIEIKAWVKDRVMNIADHMQETDTKPDVICCTVLIDGQCNFENLISAQKMFDGMLKEGFKPDAQAYTALIHGYCSIGNIKKAQGLFQKMVDRGIQPDYIASEVMNKALLRVRDG